MWHAVAPIGQFQVTQRDVDRLEVAYVMERSLNKDEEQRLETALAEKLGHRFAVRWIRAEVIERGAGGKYEDFVSLLT